ncbi:MAG: TonB-dependent receptor [Pseudomonadales bacterium]|nr:TonB-dependent receptor [Pseudomonadales bacterium]
MLDALAVVGWVMPGCMHYEEVPINAGPQVHPGYGAYCGDPAGATPYDQDNDGDAVYEHDNLVKSENTAFYTQGDLKLTDTLSVTLGFRYSKDDRWGLERRGGYSELNANDYSAWLPWAIACVTGGGAGIGCPDVGMSVVPGFATGWELHTIPGVNWWEHFGPGVNGLAAMNVAMGNATYSGDPDFPITPTCSLDAVSCAHPLRLEGIPISWGSRISGEYENDWDTTWRVNFNWEPSDNVLVYFGATTGYRAGGWDMGGPDNRALFDADGTGTCVNGGDESGCDFRALLNYDGEDITSYEIGYKGTHLDGKLQVNMAAYYYDYENYQDHIERWEESNGSFSLPDLTLPDGSALGAPPGRGPVSVTVNIPQAVNKGFEIDGLYLFNDNLTVGGNYSYTISEYDSKFTFFNEDDPRYPRNVFGGDLSENPCNMAPEIRALYCLQVDGFQLTGIPEHKATAWASYTWYLAPGTLTWQGSVTYVGEYPTHPFNRPWDIVPERERVDMRLTFREGAGRWEASVFVDNVMDETYIRDSDMSERLTGYGSNWPQRVIALYPRFWGAEFTYNFGGAVR